MIRLLVIDDDDFDIMAFKRFFKNNTNFELETVHSLREAMEKIKNTSFDILISDFNLKDGNAFELLEVKGNTPIIIITGVDNTYIALEALKIGVYDFIVKDSKGDYLKTLPILIKNAMERKKAELKLKEYQKELENIISEKTIALENEINDRKKTEKELILAQREIKKAKNSMIFALATLAESRDSETGAHTLRIREYCKCLSLRLKKEKQFKHKITKQFIDDIYHTSILHDIGKVGIPDSILLKKGKLTEEEFEIMKTHSEIGGRTLAKVYESHPTHSFLEMATDIVLHHHEKWNGEGYPRKLCAHEISLASRITTFADIFDALMSKRIYKEAFSKEKTLEIMRSEKGVTLDPYIFPYFEEIFDDFVKIFKEFEDDSVDVSSYYL
jgi:response regulator RpfG family c-di-GMP phosphodiesterase